jgi:hypothetical protein
VPPHCRLLAIFLFIFLGTAGVFFGEGVNLAWDHNPEPDIAGYHVLFGVASGDYTQSIDAGPATTATISDLSPGTTYFFAVTAYNTSGVESLPSGEVSYSVPGGPAPQGLVNVSTRGYVQTGENVLIGGVIIAGDTPKRVVLRAIGPSLAAAGVSGALPDPMLSLHDSTGATIAANDNWRTGTSDPAATGLAPSNDLEAAIVTTLAPGTYTAVVAGAGSSTGIALFEIYDVEQANSRLANISTRGRVEAGDNLMIGGFILGGDQPSQVVVRALGPSLTAHGIAGALANPILELFNDHGTRIYVNDDWRSEQAAQISAVSLAPSDERESAIIATLPPGNYTAIVRGTQNSTGVCLVEVYDVTR